VKYGNREFVQSPLYLSRELSLSLSLSLFFSVFHSALIDLSMPRGKVRGTSVPAVPIGLGRYVFLSADFIPVAPPYPWNGPLRQHYRSILWRYSPQRVKSKQKFRPPTTIHRYTSRSLCELVPRSPNVDLHRFAFARKQKSEFCEIPILTITLS